MQHEYVLWIVVIAMVMHVMEEQILGWRAWAKGALGLDISEADFACTNAAMVVIGVAGALIGWRLPEVSLMPVAPTLVNALIFHIGITLVQRRFSPGTISATLVYLPVGVWTYWAAHADGVLSVPVVLISSAGGALLMAYPIILLRVRSRLTAAGLLPHSRAETQTTAD